MWVKNVCALLYDRAEPQVGPAKSLLRTTHVLRTPYSVPIKWFISTRWWSGSPLCLLGALRYLWPLKACCLWVLVSAGLVKEWRWTETDHAVTFSVPLSLTKPKTAALRRIKHCSRMAHVLQLVAATYSTAEWILSPEQCNRNGE